MKDSKNKTIKAGLGYTLGNFFIKGLNFLTIPIFVRLLSPEDYGQYNTYFAYVSIFFPIIGLTLEMSLKNAKYKYNNDYGKYISSIILFKLILTLIWMIVAYLFRDIIVHYSGFNIFVIYILVLECLCSSLINLYNIDLSLSYSYKSYIIVAAINAVFNILFSIIFIITIFTGERFLGRIFGAIIPMLIISIYICFYYWLKNRPRVFTVFWRFAFLFSLPLIPHVLSQVVLNQFDRIMIKNFVSLSSVGIYSFAYNIFSILLVFYTSLDNVWGPWFYEKYSIGDIYTIKEKSFLYAFGMSIISLMLILVSPDLISFLGTNDYLNAKYVVIPICTSGFFIFLYSMPAQIEYYHGKTSYLACGTLFAALLNILLNWIFIPIYGYVGAAYTTLITYIIYCIAHFKLADLITNQHIFYTKKIFFLSLGLLSVSMISVFFVDYWYIRWLFLLILIMLSLIYIQKNRIIDFNQIYVNYFRRYI